MAFSNLKIGSLNCRGLNHCVKAKRISAFLKKNNLDIVCLQETHLRKGKDFVFSSKVFSSQIMAPGSSSSRGVAIVFSNRVNFQLGKVFKDPVGRYIFVKGRINDEPITIASIYVPNSGQVGYFRDVLENLNLFQEGPLIIGTDLNFVVNKSLDIKRPPGKKRLKTGSSAISQLLVKYDLTDIWRFLNTTDKSYTYFSSRFHTYTRIDYLFVSASLVPQISTADIGQIFLSDHALVSMSFSDLEKEKSYRTWSLNNALLDDPLIAQKIEANMKEYFVLNTTPDVSIQTTWEASKAVIRGHFLALAAAKKKHRDFLTKHLLQRIEVLSNLHKKTCSKKIYAQLLLERKKLEVLESSQIKTNLLLLRQYQFVRHSKSLSILANKIKQRRLKNKIVKIRDSSGEIKFKPSNISEVFFDFYSNLYSSTNPKQDDITGFFNSCGFNSHLLPTHISALEMPISEEEILMAIQKLKLNKSPGLDGFTSNYYKKFSSILLTPMAALFNEVFSTGILPPSWNQARLIMIHKKGHDAVDCRSYRPISVLNQDYKIFASVLSSRLNGFIGDYISEDQTGFIPGRDIGDNIRKTVNIIQHASKTSSIQSCLLSLDISKAFDSVETSFLIQVLKKMGFGPLFCNTIQAIYSSPVSFLHINNNLSPPIKLSRGTRQGCPLSPLLFALAIEPLALALRSHPLISGISVGYTSFLLSLFADDIVIYVSNPSISLPAIQDTLLYFQQASGLSVNQAKSYLYPITLDSETRTWIKSLYKYTWITSTWHYLGIDIPLNISHISSHTQSVLSHQLRCLLKDYNNQFLSLLERIQTIKVFILPKFLYIFRVLPIWLPKSFLIKCQKDIFRFIWNNKPHRISKLHMKRSVVKGGLAVPDLLLYNRATILAGLVKLYNTNYKTGWKLIENHLFLPYSFSELLWNNKANSEKPLIASYFFLEAMFKTWNIVRPLLAPQVSLLTVFTGQRWFPPARCHSSFSLWKQSSLNTFFSLLRNGKMIDKCF